MAWTLLLSLSNSSSSSGDSVPVLALQQLLCVLPILHISGSCRLADSATAVSLQ
jgi:hypothetical protein